VADLGPAPAQEVLTHLLNGSRFNFLILNSARNPLQLDRVILTPRGEGMTMPVSPVQSVQDDSEEAAIPEPPPEMPPAPPIPPAPMPGPRGRDIPQPPDEDAPEL